MRIAILMSNTDRSAFAGRHPKDGAKWTDLLSPLRPDWRFEVWDATAGQLPHGPDGIDGAIVTGSPASVNDGDAWIAALLALIRRLDAARVPLFGACFGHQAIAVALGGEVRANSGPFVLGVAEAEVTATAPWMDDAPPRLCLAAAHGEQVTRLPAGAEVLAAAPDCPVAGYAIGRHVFATEYHPEIAPDFLAALVDDLDGRLDPAVTARARASLDRATDRALFARWIVAFFEQARG